MRPRLPELGWFWLLPVTVWLAIVLVIAHFVAKYW